MKRFKKILVGVDLSDDERFVGKGLPNSTREAIRQAEWLAKANSAELLFLYVLPPQAHQLSHDRQILMAEGDVYKSVMEDASEVLAEIAKSSAKQGLRTTSRVVFGRCWIELVREAHLCECDIIIAGTRRLGPFRSLIFGSTGIKLLRKCPYPVWITKPGIDGDERVQSILVAHDLSTVGDSALEIGCSMAQMRGTVLHVFHSIEHQSPATRRAEAPDIENVETRIRDQLRRLEIDDSRVIIKVTSGNADGAILDYIEKNEIQLTVMGTIARSGIAGILVGNTAEKLLPLLPCSVLAIKPAGFKEPGLPARDEDERV